MSLHDDDRERFLQALAADEDDEAPRLGYSDWLEERGEYEEAERQRAWPAAKAWLVQLVAEHSEYDDYDYDTHDRRIPAGAQYTTYEGLVEMGRQAAADGDWAIHCGRDESLCDAPAQ
jgi:uncharacterized protein (TIGR02996 family)